MTHHNARTNGNAATTIGVGHNITKTDAQKSYRNEPHGI